MDRFWRRRVAEAISSANQSCAFCHTIDVVSYDGTDFTVRDSNMDFDVVVPSATETRVVPFMPLPMFKPVSCATTAKILITENGFLHMVRKADGNYMFFLGESVSQAQCLERNTCGCMMSALFDSQASSLFETQSQSSTRLVSVDRRPSNLQTERRLQRRRRRKCPGSTTLLIGCFTRKIIKINEVLLEVEGISQTVQAITHIGLSVQQQWFRRELIKNVDGSALQQNGHLHRQVRHRGRRAPSSRAPDFCTSWSKRAHGPHRLRSLKQWILEGLAFTGVATRGHSVRRKGYENNTRVAWHRCL